MSRTRHHSMNWGSHHRFSRLEGKVFRTGMCGCEEASESTNAWSHRNDIKPARHMDKSVLRGIKKGVVDPDAVVMPYTGTRRPHEYQW